MKKFNVIFITICIWGSLIILISESSTYSQIQQKDTIVKQDSMKKKSDMTRMTDIQRKQMEQRQIMKGFDKSIYKQEKQIMYLDSLMGKKDTTKIKK